MLDIQSAFQNFVIKLKILPFTHILYLHVLVLRGNSDYYLIHY